MNIISRIKYCFKPKSIYEKAKINYSKYILNFYLDILKEIDKDSKNGWSITKAESNKERVLLIVKKMLEEDGFKCSEVYEKPINLINLNFDLPFNPNSYFFYIEFI